MAAVDVPVGAAEEADVRPDSRATAASRPTASTQRPSGARVRFDSDATAASRPTASTQRPSDSSAQSFQRGVVSMVSVATSHAEPARRMILAEPDRDDPKLGSPAALCLQSAAACAMPCLVPLVVAFRSVGFEWASRHSAGGFSTIAPLVFGSLILGSAFLALLLARHGAGEARQLLDRGYLGFVAPSLLRSGMFVCENFALAGGTSPTLLVMLMKSALLPGVLGEMWLTQTRPWLTQLCLIAALLLCVVLYTSADGMAVSGAGLALGLAAANCDFLGGLALEAGVKLRCGRAGVDPGAEKIRCLLMNEVWKSLTLLLLLVAFEPGFVADGVVRGWNVQVMLGAVLTVPMMVVVYNYSVIAAGTLQTNIFCSVDIGAAYAMEFAFFGEAVTLSACLTIAVITLLIVTYTTFAQDLRKHARAVLAGLGPGDDDACTSV